MIRSRGAAAALEWSGATTDAAAASDAGQAASVVVVLGAMGAGAMASAGVATADAEEAAAAGAAAAGAAAAVVAGSRHHSDPTRRPCGAYPNRAPRSGKMAYMDSAVSPRVLVVDDDDDVLASLERGLRLSGFDVSTAKDGAEALRSATETRPDAIVLDINMPVLDGVSVVTALRAMDNDVPVCVLSARSSVDDRVAGLEAGADDYLVKPFVLAELVARVKALLRRRGATATFSSETITVGPLEVDIPGRRARVNGVDVDLTKREFDLLAVLAEHKTAVLSRAQLLELVWGYDFAADTNVVDVFIGYLRRKLEAGGAPRLLHTVRGVGFVLRQQ
ncbi:hypothetical protein MAGR_72810 [Mycolicibacterium agri]|uniref:Transcriptional regulatory protein PrrA n=3 Tax=Mycolicibacterium agri TaxID=36811 RepID=A0A7I9WES7_MYCAG|nr:hypothetical protein MAGR_72810 [Mycolicibacterium agri]